MVAGALTVSSPAAMAGMRWQDSWFALGTAFLWALSPIFTIEGLQEVDSPLFGVTVGVVSLGRRVRAAARCSGRAAASGRARCRAPGWRSRWSRGAIVALATWGRWEALDLADVGVVLALNLLSVPAVLILAPLIGGPAVRAA